MPGGEITRTVDRYLQDEELAACRADVRAMMLAAISSGSLLWDYKRRARKPKSQEFHMGDGWDREESEPTLLSDSRL